jgi:hypothetical protein
MLPWTAKLSPVIPPAQGMHAPPLLVDDAGLALCLLRIVLHKLRERLLR